MTHTFLVTVVIDDEEDLDDVANEIIGELAAYFGDKITVVPWSSHNGNETL
jgi:hypothetical protein